MCLYFLCMNVLPPCIYVYMSTIYVCVLCVPCMYVYYMCLVCVLCMHTMCTMNVCILCARCVYVYYVDNMCAMHVCALCVPEALGGQKAALSLLTCKYRSLWYVLWLLGTKLGSSVRAGSALGHSGNTWALPTLLFKARSLTDTWDSQIRLSWLTSEAQWVRLHLSGSWIARKCHHTWLCMWLLRTKFGGSCLFSF